MPSLLQGLRSPKPSREPPKYSAEDTSNPNALPSKENKPLSGTMDILRHGKEKRRSLAGTTTERSASPSTRKAAKDSPKPVPPKPALLEIDMESPPLVFYGQPGQSTGALLSGQLILTVKEPEVSIKTFEMVLLAKVTTKRPVKHDCPDCTTKTTEMFRWKFLSEPAHFARKEHAFPFSYLLPGHLPATCHGTLGTIDYILSAEAITNFSESINIQRTLNIQRALMPNQDKTSTRIFPPTNLVATVVLPSVIHPIGEFPVHMRLAGVVNKGQDSTMTRWRIRRMHWRIDETFRTVSEACKKHAAKVGGEGKGILNEDIREIGRDDLKEGWKTDFDTEGGVIECEFPAAIRPGSNPSCDVESPTGLSATHTFAIEIIVAEEHCTTKHPKQAIPTGSARVLRMQFKLTVTERAGMGISWDEEQPPMYEDVPLSPPTYAQMGNYEGEPLPDEPLDRLQ